MFPPSLRLPPPTSIPKRVFCRRNRRRLERLRLRGCMGRLRRKSRRPSCIQRPGRGWVGRASGDSHFAEPVRLGGLRRRNCTQPPFCAGAGIRFRFARPIHRRLAGKTAIVPPFAGDEMVPPSRQLGSPEIRRATPGTPESSPTGVGFPASRSGRGAPTPINADAPAHAKPDPPISRPPKGVRLLFRRFPSIRFDRRLTSSRNCFAGADRYLPLRTTNP